MSVRNRAQDDAVAAASFASTSYRTLVEPCTLTLEVKKSKFIAVATAVDDEAAALSFLSQVVVTRISSLSMITSALYVVLLVVD